DVVPGMGHEGVSRGSDWGEAVQTTVPPLKRITDDAPLDHHKWSVMLLRTVSPCAGRRLRAHRHEGPHRRNEREPSYLT
ncbi:MAG: hypothetical protein KGM43_17440, partial [Planctomycetota bacterium]|nr:hypothetical protein [Planctomycetota bacterium]